MVACGANLSRGQVKGNTGVNERSFPRVTQRSGEKTERERKREEVRNPRDSKLVGQIRVAPKAVPLFSRSSSVSSVGAPLKNESVYQATFSVISPPEALT